MFKRNRGFTLVELLVVIVVIGMLVGLLLPAINAAREAARQAKCANNQKDIATAIINYDTAKQHLPGYINLPFMRPDGTTWDTTVISWPMAIFPDIGYKDVWDYVFGTGNRNWDVDQSDLRLSQFICPDDSTAKLTTAPTGCTLGKSGRPLSYVVNNTAPVVGGVTGISYFADRSDTNNASSLPTQTIAQVTNQVQTVMLGERTDLKKAPRAGPWGLWKRSGDKMRERLTFTWNTGSTIASDSPGVLSSMHPKVVIVTYFDGHTATVRDDASCGDTSLFTQ